MVLGMVFVFCVVHTEVHGEAGRSFYYRGRLVQETNDVVRNESELRHSIYMAAMATIPKSSGKLVRKAVPWWKV